MKLVFGEIPVPRRLSDFVYAYLEESIMDQKCPPGTQLVVEEVASQMQVSVTPVRAALMRLEQEGLVQQRPHRSYVVREFTERDVAELYDLREALETLAVRKAIPKLTRDHVAHLRRLHETMLDQVARDDVPGYRELNTQFHRYLLEVADNAHVISVMQSVQKQISFVTSNTARIPGFLEQAVAEHGLIVEALAQRNQARAEQLVAEHIRRAGAIMLQELRKRKARTEAEDAR